MKQGLVMIDQLRKTISRDSHARLVGRKHDHQWCHLWCEVGGEEALHELAAKIGMRRHWFQNKIGFPHYDLVPTRRDPAIKAGAVETDLREWIKAKRTARDGKTFNALRLTGHTDQSIAQNSLPTL